MTNQIYIEKAETGLRLRAPVTEDMEMLRAMLNDPKIEYSVMGWGLPVSAAEQLDWFHNRLPGRSDIRYYMIEKDGAAIGSIILDQIDWEMRTSQVGIKILRARQGTRTTLEAVTLFLKHYFMDMEMQCLYGSCLPLQLATLRLVKCFGFTEEGRQRSSIYKHGRYHDIIHFSQLREDYRKWVGI